MRKFGLLCPYGPLADQTEHKDGPLVTSFRLFALLSLQRWCEETNFGCPMQVFAYYHIRVAE